MAELRQGLVAASRESQASSPWSHMDPQGKRQAIEWKVIEL
jgi:hypothetical protein